MIVLFRIFCFVIGYFVGCINPAYLIAKSKGVNIKEEGSGNAGTTNTLRVLGKKAGASVLILDILKAVIAALICIFLFDVFDGAMNNSQLYLVYSAFGTIIGHCFPFYLKFNGGKGVAATLGATLMIDWRVALIALAIFLIIVLVTKYVSLGSIISALTFFIGFTILALKSSLIINDHNIESIVIVGLIVVLIVFNHRSNISRLIAGNENKIGSKKE